MSDIHSHIQKQLQVFRIPSAKITATEILVEPWSEKRLDLYSGIVVEVIVVAEVETSYIVYRPDLDGKSQYLWGVVKKDGTDLGTDGAWYLTLEDAFYATHQNHERPENYEVG